MFERLTRRLHTWHMRNVTRRKLERLDDRILADMGIERDQIGDFVSRHAPSRKLPTTSSPPSDTRSLAVAELERRAPAITPNIRNLPTPELTDA